VTSRAVMDACRTRHRSRFVSGYQEAHRVFPSETCMPGEVYLPGVGGGL